MSERKNFESLYKTVDEIRQVFEQRELEKMELAEIRKDAKLLFEESLHKYRSEEDQLNKRIEKEKKKCEEWGAEFRVLSTEKTKCDMQGREFKEDKRYTELMQYLSTYQLIMQGMEATRKSIVISAEAQRNMDNYCNQGSEKSRKIKTMGETISMLLGKLKGEDALMCLAGFDYRPGSGEFTMPELKEWESLRMEDIEE